MGISLVLVSGLILLVYILVYVIAIDILRYLQKEDSKEKADMLNVLMQRYKLRLRYHEYFVYLLFLIIIFNAITM